MGIIAIGSDHGGFALKKTIISYLVKNNLPCKDYGIFEDVSSDYPDIAKPLCKDILSNECELGILICGTGIGMSISANRHAGIRAALCNNEFSARMTREHNNANVLVLGARTIGEGLALSIVKTFLTTSFSNDERHIRRISKIEL